MHPQIKFIYFDVGMILDIYPKQFVLPEGYTQFEPKLTRWYLEKDYDLCHGNVSLAENWGEFCNHSGFPETVIPDVTKHIVNQHSPRKEMHSLADQLRKHYQIGLLTNMYPGMLPFLFESANIPPIDWFSVVIDSSVVHAVKPEVEIYDIATKRAGLRPEEIAFVDDRLNNVEAAINFGWTAWHFDIENPNHTIEEMARTLLE